MRIMIDEVIFHKTVAVLSKMQKGKRKYKVRFLVIVKENRSFKSKTETNRCLNFYITVLVFLFRYC